MILASTVLSSTEHRSHSFEIVVLWLVLCSGVVCGQDVNQKVAELEAAVKEFHSVATLRKEIAELGNAAIPALAGSIQNATNDHVRRVATEVVCSIPGPESWEALLAVVVSQRAPEVYPALEALAVRAQVRPLTAAEVSSLADLVRDEDPLMAGHAATILSKSSADPAQRMQPILDRIVAIVARPAGTPVKVNPVGYLSPEAKALWAFARRFENIQHSSVIAAIRARHSTAIDPHLKAWLIICLGFAGDSTVEPELRSLIGQSTDVSVRAIALHSLTVLIGSAALPLLEDYRDDNTPLEPDVPEQYRRYPLRVVSRILIARL